MPWIPVSVLTWLESALYKLGLWHPWVFAVLCIVVGFLCLIFLVNLIFIWVPSACHWIWCKMGGRIGFGDFHNNLLHLMAWIVVLLTFIGMAIWLFN